MGDNSKLDNLEDVCKRELAVLFSHINGETGLQTDLEEFGKSYRGRGPLQIEGSHNYGEFSKVAFESQYNSHMILLNNPDLVHEDPFLAFMSALWLYMTPKDS